jgi:ATP-binding cassette subfamily B (MDR/TAP) protein 1
MLYCSAGMEKVCTVIRTVCTLICGIIIGFTTSWQLTLVIMGCAPFFVVAICTLLIGMSRSEAKTQKAYSRAGEVATEVYSLIRTVAAYSGERHEVERYDCFLGDALRAGCRKGLVQGFSIGLMLFAMYGTYGVATWAGAEFIIASTRAHPECAVDFSLPYCFTGGKVVQTFVAVMLGALSFGTIGPALAAVSSARASAAALYKIIDRVPRIDVYAAGGHDAEIRGKVLGRVGSGGRCQQGETAAQRHSGLAAQWSTDLGHRTRAQWTMAQ